MIATVNVSKSAIFEMLMAAFEAYAIKHENKSEIAIETFAHLWGSCNKRLPFKCNIEHVSVETSAEREQDSVTTSRLSLDLKKDIANVFGDGYQHLGSFHTHPWLRGDGSEYAENADMIRKHKLFNFSQTDHNSEIGHPTVQVGKSRFSVALVITMFPLEKANDQKDGYVDSGLYEISMGNIKIWFKAQVYKHIEKYKMTDSDIKEFEQYNLNINDYKDTDILPLPVFTRLESEFLSPLCYAFKGFGRIKFNEDEQCFYHSTESAENRELYRA
ncbi:hypothetical protein MD588_24420 [Photobacterium sp. SDRW27]|uniref:hypothetical protein n=1 Tax=Photobacterium obscurum TaxID=2829490 RepID=UPI002244A671|nr:hypothetical protein [Photobacterium obscurum]MCW8331946.1 hypothetical protein [Photobacterium obscurum]